MNSQRRAFNNPTEQHHADGPNRGEKPLTKGLPKHGTRWARAQNSHARESLTKGSARLHN